MVAVPTRGLIDHRTVNAIIEAVDHTRADLDGTRITFDCAASPLVSANRIFLAEQAKKENRSHIIWVDDDMVFPNDAFARLLRHKKPIIAANYTTRSIPPLPHAVTDGQRVPSLGKTGLEAVHHTGMGLMLTAVKVFRKIGEPYFHLGWAPKAREVIGEDVWFCRLCRQAGYDIWIDHDLSNEVAHLGSIAFTHDLTQPA